MNDFERKLRDTPMRTPPRGWRAEILAALPANQPAALRWRAWLWPSPRAWAALAAIWLVLIAIESFTGTPLQTPSPLPTIAIETPPPDSLIAYQTALNSAGSRDLFQ